MAPGAWLVLATVLSTGQPYSVAWPAPDAVASHPATATAAPGHALGLPVRAVAFGTSSE